MRLLCPRGRGAPTPPPSPPSRKLLLRALRPRAVRACGGMGCAVARAQRERRSMSSMTLQPFPSCDLFSHGAPSRGLPTAESTSVPYSMPPHAPPREALLTFCVIPINTRGACARAYEEARKREWRVWRGEAEGGAMRSSRWVSAAWRTCSHQVRTSVFVAHFAILYRQYYVVVQVPTFSRPCFSRP